MWWGVVCGAVLLSLCIALTSIQPARYLNVVGRVCMRPHSHFSLFGHGWNVEDILHIYSYRHWWWNNSRWTSWSWSVKSTLSFREGPGYNCHSQGSIKRHKWIASAVSWTTRQRCFSYTLTRMLISSKPFSGYSQFHSADSLKKLSTSMAFPIMPLPNHWED